MPIWFIGNFAARLLLSIVLMSCKHQEIQLSKQQIKYKADSIFNVRVNELTNAAAEDLDRRSAIEVKAKADSIVEAYSKTHSIVPVDTITQ